MPLQTVTIRVPASTSNLGSGFDTLGLALRLYRFVRVTRHARRGVTAVPKGGPSESRSLNELLNEATDLFFHEIGTAAFGVDVAVSGDVPVARGLGASATVRVGVLAGLNVLAGTGLDRQQLLQFATALEGHPDNASPALFGGFTVSGFVGRAVRCLAFPVSPRLKCVTLIPPFGVKTKVARRLIPASYSKADTTHALNRAALISAAFASGDYQALRGLFDDRVHQPHRARLIPQLNDVIRAGERAGALGGFLSGSGSAIICLTTGRAAPVAEAMRGTFPGARVLALAPDPHGLRVVGRADRLSR